MAPTTDDRPTDHPHVDHPHADHQPADLRISIAKDLVGAKARLSVAGEIDLLSSPALRAATAELIAAGAEEVDFDLSAVTFAGASLLHELVAVRHAGAVPSVSGATPFVQRVLAAGGLAEGLAVSA